MLARVGGRGGSDQLRGQLAVRGGQVDDLMAVVLNGTGLVGADVGGGGGDDRLVGTEKGPDGSLVGLGSPHQEVDGGLRAAAQAPDSLRRLFAIRIQAVAGGQLQVGPAQGLQHRRVGSGAVVVAEVEHEKRTSFSKIFSPPVYQSRREKARRLGLV